MYIFVGYSRIEYKNKRNKEKAANKTKIYILWIVGIRKCL